MVKKTTLQSVLDDLKIGGNIDKAQVYALLCIGEQLERIADHLTKEDRHGWNLGEQMVAALRGIEMHTSDK